MFILIAVFHLALLKPRWWLFLLLFANFSLVAPDKCDMAQATESKQNHPSDHKSFIFSLKIKILERNART